MKIRSVSSLMLVLVTGSMTLLVAQEPKCHNPARECSVHIQQMLGGRRYLGVQVVELKPGLVIKTVLADSPASRVLMKGDRLVAVNGRSLLKATARDFKQILSEASATGKVWMIVQRRGAYRKIEARLQPYPKEYIEKAISGHLAAGHTATAGADQ